MLRGYSRVSGFLLALVSVSLLAASANAAPVLIDDFAGTTLGFRTVSTTGGSFPAPVPGTLTFTGGTELKLTYSLIGGVDLGSPNNAIAIVVDSLVAGVAGVNLMVTVKDTVPNPARSFTLNNIGAGTHVFEYANFLPGSPPFVFDDVDEIEVKFSSLNPFAVTVSDIQAVPEPGTAAMLSMGLLGLAFGGRRKVA